MVLGADGDARGAADQDRPTLAKWLNHHSGRVRKKLGMGPDSLLQVTLSQGELRIRPVSETDRAAGSPWLKDLFDLFAPVRQEAEAEGYSEEEIDLAIDEAVKAVRQTHA